MNTMQQNSQQHDQARTLIGKPVRIALAPNHVEALRSVISTFAPATLYTLWSIDPSGIYLGTNDQSGQVQNRDRDRGQDSQSTFFIPWTAIVAIVPANFASSQRSAA